MVIVVPTGEEELFLDELDPAASPVSRRAIKLVSLNAWDTRRLVDRSSASAVDNKFCRNSAERRPSGDSCNYVSQHGG